MEDRSSPFPIAAYALLSDRQTAALIAAGSVDWFCLPRFDSASVFSRLLGDRDASRWLIAPQDGHITYRSYRENSFILDTAWTTPTGAASSTDFLPTAHTADRVTLIRTISCTAGQVVVDAELIIRFGYGRVVPWVRRATDPAGQEVLYALAGPDSLTLHGPRLQPSDMTHQGRFILTAGNHLTWTMTWRPSHLPIPETRSVIEQLQRTSASSRRWHADLDVSGPHSHAVARSFAVLRALTHHHTGGIVAAATTSLPEQIGGSRNWDYRYCWLRDSAMIMTALVGHGHHKVAGTWRNWLLRAIAGDPEDLQIMYGIAGERELPERELEHLSGYRGSSPVRVGNRAVFQNQADVIGEVMLALAALRAAGMEENDNSWALQTTLLAMLAQRVDVPDHGIWEVRGPPRHFTHGRVLMWAAFDAGIRAVADQDLAGPVEEWRTIRDQLRATVLREGVRKGSFVQHSQTHAVDAALLQIPHTGFVSYDDPLMLATVTRIEQELLDEQGFVRRYLIDGSDGLCDDEGSFLMCSFWLVEQYAHSGRRDEASALMDRLLNLANDVGLLAEEYDAVNERMLGNYPQAYSHLALIRAADALESSAQPGAV